MTTAKPVVAAVIVAAGQGLRMGGIDKVLSPLAAEPILLRATRQRLMARIGCLPIPILFQIVSGVSDHS